MTKILSYQHFSRWILLVVTVHVTSHCGPLTDEETVQNIPDILNPQDIEERKAAIVNGTEDVAHAEVGVLKHTSGLLVGSCTATLIGKRVILTAAHCFIDFDMIREVGTAKFFPGSSGSTQAGITGIPLYSVILHPQWTKTVMEAGRSDGDVAIGFLQSEVNGIEPARLNNAAPHKGDKIQLIGYGTTAEAAKDFGTRRQAANDIATVLEYTYKYNGSWWEEGTICSGDSGGPSFSTTKSVRTIVGIHSRSTCELKKWGVFDASTATDVRVDAYYNWIMKNITNPPPLPVPIIKILSPIPDGGFLPADFVLKFKVSSKNKIIGYQITLDQQRLTQLNRFTTEDGEEVHVEFEHLLPGDHLIRIEATAEGDLASNEELSFKVMGQDLPSAPNSPQNPTAPNILPGQSPTGGTTSPTGGILEGGCHFTPHLSESTCPWFLLLSLLFGLRIVRRPFIRR